MSEPKTIQFRSRSRRAGYTQMDNPVLRSKGLSASAKITWGLLCFYAREDESCYPGQARLAEEVPCSERALRDYIGELAKVGLVEVVRRGLGLTNMYVLNDLETLTPEEVPAEPDGQPVPDGEANAADQVGQQPPLLGSTKTQTTKTQKKKGSAGAPPVDSESLPIWTFDGRDLSSGQRRTALNVHGFYNELAGQSLSAFRPSNGKPSEHLTRITGAVLDHELELDEWRGMIAYTLCKPWWGKGAPSPGVVFGPNVIDTNLAKWRQAGSPPPESSVQSTGRTDPTGEGYDKHVRWD